MFERLSRLLIRRIAAGSTRLTGPAVVSARLVLRFTPQAHAERAWRLSALGLALEKRFDVVGTETLLDESVSCHREAVRLAGDGSPDLGLCLSNAVTALLNREEFVEEAVGLARQAVALSALDDTVRVGRLSNLAMALLRRHQVADDTAALYEAADVLRTAMNAGTEADRIGFLPNLLAILEECHRRSGESGYLDEAIDLARGVLARLAADDAGRPDLADSLAGLLRSAYGYGEDVKVLDEAVRLLREAIAGLPSSADEYGRYAANLSIILRVRHDHTHSQADIEEAIALARIAVASPSSSPVARANRLAVLGNALLSQYESNYDRVALNQAVAVAQEALQVVPPDHPDRVDHLSNLSNALAYSAREDMSSARFAQAIDLARAALAATPDDGPDYSSRQVGLASLLSSSYFHTGDALSIKQSLELTDEVRSRNTDGSAHDHATQRAARRVRADGLIAAYQTTGDPSLLAEAVEAFREALDDTPSDHERRVPVVADLADALFNEYGRTGELDLLEEAMGWVRDVVDRMAPGDPGRPGLQVILGNALRAYGSRLSSSESADEAIARLRDAVATSQDSPNSWILLSDLACALHEPRSRDESPPPEALAEAVAMARTAVDRCPAGHPERGMALSNLAVILPEDAEVEAVGLAEEAVRLTAAGSPARGGYLVNLGNLLSSQWRRHPGVAAPWHAALGAYREAAGLTSIPVPVRVDAASAWGGLAAEQGDWNQAIEGYETAIALLPQLVSRTLARADQQHHLSRLTSLSADAAACAVRLDDPRRALVLAEQSRGMLLAQHLDSWPERSDVWRVAPDLARRFDQLCADLVRVGGEAVGRSGRQALSARWDSLVGEIRQQPELSGFLRPPSDAELIVAADRGPVVVVNSSRFGPHALLVHSGEVRSLALPGLEPERVANRAYAFLAALDDVEDDEIGPGRMEANRNMRDTLDWLWQVVARPVLDELGFTTPPAGDSWPRLWWSPTGLMSVFPLHAAGSQEMPDNSVLDRVVPSYTPTVRALGHTLSRRRTAGAPTLLVVSPTEPHEEDGLLGADQEAALLRAGFPGQVTVLAGTHADRDRVLAELPRHSWVHFACHAVTELEDPSASRLFVADGDTRPLRVPDIDRLRLSDAAFAYLAACDASGVSVLPNEAIHLASAFHLAGYGCVVSTLWSVSDRISASCAKEFYGEVLNGGILGGVGDDRFAKALHTMVRRLRSRWPRHPSTWATFVHIGR